MYTERLAVLLLGLMLLACSTSEEGPPQPPVDDIGVPSNYSILLSDGTTLKSTSYEANAVGIMPQSGTNDLQPIGFPELTYRDALSFSFLKTEGNCTAMVHYWEAATATIRQIALFVEEPDCERNITSVAHSGKQVLVSYGRPGDGPKVLDYFISSIPLAEGGAEWKDLALEKEPLQLLWSSDRIFVLNFDHSNGKNSLLVLDDSNGQLINELDLGTDVLKILKNSAGQLLVSYKERHLLIDAHSLETLSRVVYTAGKEPNFGNSEVGYFDPGGTLYYSMPTGLNSTEYEHIPGVYNFEKHTAYLYYFENFLTEERRELFDIGDTRALGYDHHNGLILIGYRKAINPLKGGLLRVKPVPEPKFVDQIDLEAVPLHILVK